MQTIHPKTLGKLLLAVPAFGLFGPLLTVMGLTEPAPSLHIIAYVGALCTGIAVAIVGAALMRGLEFATEPEAPRLKS